MFPESLELCTNLLNEFISNPDAEQFLKPVPWKEWNLLDYPTIVKHPMDLTTMKTKLTNSEYKDVYAFGDDMRLIWNNCILYNPEGTDIRFIALQLQARFEERFKEILAALPEKEKKPTVQKKTDFSNTFNLLTAQQITHVVKVLKEQCPESLVEKPNGDIEIKVDAIYITPFHDLYDYVLESAKNNNYSFCFIITLLFFLYYFLNA